MKYVILWALVSVLLFLVSVLTVLALEHSGRFYKAHKLKPFAIYSMVSAVAAVCAVVGIAIVRAWSVL